MKTVRLFALTSALLAAVRSGQAQATFTNLDFESADVPTVPYGQYGEEFPTASALPGWSASIGGVAVTEVVLNAFSGGAASIDLFGPGWTNVYPGVIDGKYTVFLQAFAPFQGAVSISQTGTIPADAESLQYKAWNVNGIVNNLSVSFDGNSLSPVVISTGQSSAGEPYDVYGANIATYAGETGQLEFSALATGTQNEELLDDITFSTTTVTPEPNTLALAVMGGLALAARRWHKSRS